MLDFQFFNQERISQLLEKEYDLKMEKKQYLLVKISFIQAI